MRFLLDTHSLIWFLSGDSQLSNKARNAIISDNSEVLVSIASLWEIAVKFSLGKIAIEQGLPRLFHLIYENRFHVLPITEQHVLTVAGLPYHHKDPFDRLMISQAMVEGITIPTRDPELKRYNVKVLW